MYLNRVKIEIHIVLSEIIDLIKKWSDSIDITPKQRLIETMKLKYEQKT